MSGCVDEAGFPGAMPVAVLASLSLARFCSEFNFFKWGPKYVCDQQ